MKLNLEQELGVSAPNVDQLKSIETIVNQALQLMELIESQEDHLKKAKAELHVLHTRTLPDAMASAGTSEFKTLQGVKVTINDFVNGSLPKDTEKRDLALSWIESVGADGIIKNKLQCDFDKGEDNLAGEVRSKLDELGIDYETKRDVHAQTLAAFARERMKKGEEVPLELLGLFAGRTAKITMPKD